MRRVEERKEWDLAEAKRLYLEEGWSPQRLACRYGCAPLTVTNRLKRAGVQMRCQRCSMRLRWEGPGRGKSPARFCTCKGAKVPVVLGTPGEIQQTEQKREVTEVRRGILEMYMEAVRRAVKAGDLKLAAMLVEQYEAIAT